MTGFLNECYFVINYIIDMGASVMLPIIIAILSIIIGVKVSKAIRAGLMIGVGFVGMGLIVDMMNQNMGPAAQAIPVAIAVNLIMFALKLTKTINIDIWNVWHMAFTGAIAYAVTGNLFFNLVNMLQNPEFKEALRQCKTPDETAKVIEKYEYIIDS